MFKKIRAKIRKLFAPIEPISPAVNRQERRTWASIARQAKRKGLRNA